MAYFFLNQVSQVTLDLAFGGMWYAIVAAEQVTEKSGNSSLSKVGLKLEPEHGKKIAKLGEMIKVASLSFIENLEELIFTFPQGELPGATPCGAPNNVLPGSGHPRFYRTTKVL